MNFDGFCGNAALKQRLGAAFSADKISHCWLLCGPHGSGRHTLARILAAAMQCRSASDVPCGHCTACRKVFADRHPDVITVDDPDHVSVGVGIVRDARADVFERPNEGKRKIYIFPQSLGIPAQNALLKILEEPPDYAAFVLLTESAEAVLPTVRSRSVQLSLSPVPQEEAVDWLKRQYPDRPARELAAAYERSGGFLGQAAELLGSEDSDPLTEAFAACMKSGDRLALLQTLVPLEKYKRDRLMQVLQQWRRLLTESLAVKSGAAAASEQASVIAAGQTAARLLHGAQALQRAVDALNTNAGVGTVIGWLSTEL